MATTIEGDTHNNGGPTRRTQEQERPRHTPNLINLKALAQRPCRPNVEVSVLTLPSSATSPELCLDSPDVAAAKALVLKSQLPAARQEKTSVDEPQRTYTFTEEELQSLFMNLLNSQNTSNTAADVDTKETCVPGTLTA
ncbi:unnamed protein product [Cyclocybe aegerita]|uniref:Uncharacterized protein n=1 Tax=Cyclocybe aegerita TaxID=1973307 RepID=A0A8S0W5A0_CYCAE|nr:unnamed protein product [Cyclocybe aegerita]